MHNQEIRYVAVADVHAGANKWGTSLERWLRPLSEAVNYSNERKAHVFLVAGDLYHHRDPNMETLALVDAMLRRLKADTLIVPGNHDLKATLDAIPATYFNNKQPYVASKMPGTVARCGTFICLPWPIVQELDQEKARLELLAELQRLSDAADDQWPKVLVGHAHVYYSRAGVEDEVPPAPTLMAGRDLLLPYEALRGMADLVVLGHVHDSRSPGYVGSTQPTDLADTGPKGFWDILFWKDSPKDERWSGPEVTFVAYKTSLTVADVHVKLSSADGGMEDVRRQLAEVGHRDVGRLTVEYTEAGHVLAGVANLRKLAEEHFGTVVGVTEIPYRGERRSDAVVRELEETREDPVDLTHIPTAVEAWALSKQLPADRVRAHTEELLGTERGESE